MLRRYIVLPVIIGLLSGLFAVLFVYALDFITQHVLEEIVGYFQPIPAGEGKRPNFTEYPERAFLLPLVVAVGGLISGLLTYYLSPESAGVGTDAAIKAYHNSEKLSLKSSLVKLITSAITIGTGGTSGREGPIALIGAGIGSSVAGLFRLSPKDRRIAIAVGLGAGIAAIFKAPLAGAIISAEVFFKKDFEIEAMIPSFIASVVSYSVFGLVFGFQPIFETEIPPMLNVQIPNLVAYVGLGVVCALVVRFYVWLFFRIKESFDNLRFPTYIKPALGGFFAGLVGMATPVAIGNGYGWLQLIMDGKESSLAFVILGIFGVILGMSFTIGSGGSGGVFGPSVIIGGLVGAAYSMSLSEFYSFKFHVPSFMIVGMVSLFAGAAKAPLSTLILIAEMTKGYELLVPAMISVFTAYFLSGKRSIFPSQVDTRLDSPAHREDWGILALERIKVREVMKTPITVAPSDSVQRAYEIIKSRLIGGLPVVKEGRLVGIITKSDIMSVSPPERQTLKVEDIMSERVLTVNPDSTLAQAFEVMLSRGIGRLPVVEENKLVGIVARADIGRIIRRVGKNPLAAT